MNLIDFIYESNRIEGIHRPPTEAEIDEFERFMLIPSVTIEELQHFVTIYQPGALLRDREGLNVRVGNHLPLSGRPALRQVLQDILDAANARASESAYKIHVRYETLHPFTDGNGRSGRMLWAWQVGYDYALALGFLHRWYYESLQHSGGIAR